MNLDRFVGFSLWMLIVPAVASGQEPPQPAAQMPQAPVTRVTERVYPTGTPTPWRSVQSTSQSADRQTVSETIETPDIEGRWKPSEQAVTETTRQPPGPAITTRDQYRRDLRNPTSLTVTHTEEDTRSAGRSTTTETTSVADINGRMRVDSRLVEDRRTVAPDDREATTTVFRPGTDNALHPSEVTESSERQVSPDIVRRGGSQSLLDVNGRWQPAAAWSGERRTVGPSEQVDDQTIERRDPNGTLVAHERIVTRRVATPGLSQVVIETYTQNAEGFVRSDSRLALSERVRISTTASADGNMDTVEEIESRNPVAPNDPMRISRRTVTAVRRVGDRWQSERRMFELDVNGRLSPVLVETQESEGR